MLLEAQQHHFSAFVVKDHYCPTMLSAYIAEKYVGDGSCRVFGGIALNNSVGGINLKAVDAAVAMGAKLVWMPTVSALRHKIMHSGKGVAFPASKGMSVAEKPIMYLQEDGSLQPQVLEVLDYLVSHPDVILATGHGSRDEIDALIHAAVERGDTIISTSFSRYFPAGILIGTVEEFELNETRTAYDVRIRLAADMTALHDVVLVKNQDYNEQRQLEEGI